MDGELVPHTPTAVTLHIGKQRIPLPTLITATGPKGAEEFVNFFTATIANDNTRAAYIRAWNNFGSWCAERGLEDIRQIRPLHVSFYIEDIGKSMAVSSVKQHRAALSKCFDFLVVRQVVPENPAAVVAAPKLRREKGTTKPLTDDEFLDLMDSIPTDTLIQRRDRAFIALLAYTWVRVSAAVGLDVGDYFAKGKRWYIDVTEKGSKEKELLVHDAAQDELDAYIAQAKLGHERELPLFRRFSIVDGRRQMTDQRLDRREALAMVKRRARKADLSWYRICNHTFRATGITNYMGNNGRLDVAQQWAGHADPRTTGGYDHSTDKVTREEIQRIRFEREDTK